MATPPPGQSKANPDSVIDHARTLVRTVVNRQVSKRMSEASGRISTLSGTIRDIGSEVQKRQPSDALDNLTATIAGRIDGVAAYLETTEPDRIYADATKFSGERPAIAALVAVGLGFAIARIVKTSVSSER